jgi:hypothetical protein
MKTALPLLIALSLPVAAAAAEPCTLIAGGGRQAASDDSDANNGWNRLNFSFFDAALSAVATDNRRVEQAFFGVDSADPGKNTDRLLAQAARAGCDKLIAVSVFADPSRPGDELVFALQVSAIRRQVRGGASVPAASLGRTEYEKEYRYAATPDTLSKVVPSRIAEQALLDYRRSAKPAPPTR